MLCPAYSVWLTTEAVAVTLPGLAVLEVCARFAPWALNYEATTRQACECWLWDQCGACTCCMFLTW